MVSWPELVCAWPAAANRESRPLNIRSALVPPKLKLKLIAASKSWNPDP